MGEFAHFPWELGRPAASTPAGASGEGVDSRLQQPDPQDRAYMSRPSPVSLETPQPKQQDTAYCETSFLNWYPKGDATITYPNDDEGSGAIPGLHTWIIEERSALIAQAFEPSSHGRRLHLDCLDSATALPLVRYLYTGSYAPAGNQNEDVPPSLLLHCKMYRLGDLYDLAELKQQAQVNVIRQCEFGCSSPSMPIDLCKAIAYAYEFLRDHTGLMENIICYCVTCFLRHRLAGNADFQRLAYTLRPFHQDLCKESMKREFEDDTAAAIIQMPFEPHLRRAHASREDLSRDRFEDVIYHFHGADDEEESKRRKAKGTARPNSTTLPMRMKRLAKGDKTVGHTPKATVLPLGCEKHNGKHPVTADKPSIKDRRKSSTGVSPEQLKVLEAENPVLIEMRQYATARRARPLEQGVDGVIGSASTFYPFSRAVAPPQYTQPSDTIVTSRFLQDHQRQLFSPEMQNKKRLLTEMQEREARRLAEQSRFFETTGESIKATAPAPAKSQFIGIENKIEPFQAEHSADDKVDSDSEYELVAAIPTIEEISSSDSETDTDAVIVEPPTPGQLTRSRALRIASAVAFSNAEPIAATASNFDDEWDLICDLVEEAQHCNTPSTRSEDL